MREIHFPGQHPDEKIILILRRHCIALLFYAFSILILALAPIVFLGIGQNFLPVFFVSPFIDLIIYAVIIFYLFLWTFVIIAWIDYYYDIWLVTNERIIEIDQRRLFNRNVSELRLTKIQDITSQVPGFIATMFKFGNISIQTAGEIERFEFTQIPHPVETRKIIVDLYDKAVKNMLHEEVKRETNGL